jgi:hypothetical protein
MTENAHKPARAGRASIDDLDAIGHELADEQLRLAAGAGTACFTEKYCTSGGGFVDYTPDTSPDLTTNTGGTSPAPSPGGTLARPR